MRPGFSPVTPGTHLPLPPHSSSLAALCPGGCGAASGLPTGVNFPAGTLSAAFCFCLSQSAMGSRTSPCNLCTEYFTLAAYTFCLLFCCTFGAVACRGGVKQAGEAVAAFETELQQLQLVSADHPQVQYCLPPPFQLMPSCLCGSALPANAVLPVRPYLQTVPTYPCLTRIRTFIPFPPRPGS